MRLIDILWIAIITILIYFYFNKPTQTNSKNYRDTIIVNDTIKVPIFKTKIITKLDTIFKKEIDSIFINSDNQKELFNFVASPFDTTIQIDTLGVIGLQYIPIKRELNFQLKLNPIIQKTITIIETEEIIKWEYVGGALLVGIILGLLVPLTN